MNNYNIKIFEAATMSDEDFESLETSLRLVMKLINASRDKNKLTKIIEEDKGYEQLDILSARVINAVTDFGLKLDEKAASVNMCQAIIDIRRDSEEIGEAAKERMFIEKMLADKMPLDLIAKYADLTVGEVKKIVRQIIGIGN